MAQFLAALSLMFRWWSFPSLVLKWRSRCRAQREVVLNYGTTGQPVARVRPLLQVWDFINFFGDSALTEDNGQGRWLIPFYAIFFSFFLSFFFLVRTEEQRKEGKRKGRCNKTHFHVLVFKNHRIRSFHLLQSQGAFQKHPHSHTPGNIEAHTSPPLISNSAIIQRKIPIAIKQRTRCATDSLQTDGLASERRKWST